MKFPKNFRNDGIFRSAFAKGLPPSRNAPAGQDGETGRGFVGFWQAPDKSKRCQLRTGIPKRLGMRHKKKTRRPNLPDAVPLNL
jgi:hypothetical protein